MPVQSEVAYQEDNEIIIESSLTEPEVVGVINTGKITFALRKSFPDNEFFDYEAKYLSKSQEITARIWKRWLKKWEISPSV
jgi:D-alanine-D-alanine ligase